MKDFKVTENADEALVTYSGKTEHFLDNNMWVVEGSYETGLHKIDGVWLKPRSDTPMSQHDASDTRSAITSGFRESSVPQR